MAPCVSMPVTLYEAVCHRWRYKDKQSCLHSDSVSERTHYLVSSTVKKKDVWNTTPPRVNKIGWKCHSSGNATVFLFPVAMHWLHQKNFKQLIVSPLRPPFSLSRFPKAAALHQRCIIAEGAWCVSVCVTPMWRTRSLDWLQRKKWKEGWEDRQVTKNEVKMTEVW